MALRMACHDRLPHLAKGGATGGGQGSSNQLVDERRAFSTAQSGDGQPRVVQSFEAGRVAVQSGPWRRRENIGPSRILPVPRQVRSRTELEWLDLQDSQVTDAGLEVLKGMTTLRGVALRGSGATPAAVAELRRIAPKMRVVD
jgi:hypothetical protein